MKNKKYVSMYHLKSHFYTVCTTLFYVSLFFLVDSLFLEMICYSIVFFFCVSLCLFFLFHFNRYNIVFLAFTYGIPMVVMIICYSVMGRELWGSQSIGENTERQTESVKSKKKVSIQYLLCQYGTHPRSFLGVCFFCLCSFICYCSWFQSSNFEC